MPKSTATKTAKTISLEHAQKVVDKHATIGEAAEALGMSVYALKKLGVKGRIGRRPGFSPKAHAQKTA